MSRWKALFTEYRTHEAARLESERRVLALEAERREREAWCKSAVERVIAEIAGLATRRSEELAVEAGVRIVVQPARRAPARQPRAEVTYVGIAREKEIVYLYAYHEPAELPLVHFMLPAYDGYLERPRHPRLVSLPGCRIARGDRGEPVLERIRVDGSLDAAEPISIDDLVFRAFELLLRGGCAKRSADVELTLPVALEKLARA